MNMQGFPYRCFNSAIAPFVSNIQSDNLGNIIAHKTGAGCRIMLVAHQDVVCLMITYIDENGFLYVQPAGLIDVSILPARKVTIIHRDKAVPGIIGKKPVHLIKEGQNTTVNYESLWIDIGATSQAEAAELVAIGDYAYFCSDNTDLQNSITSCAYHDNQVGVTILLKLAEELKDIVIPWDIYFVASNYEEIGMRGAFVAAHSIKPDVCICIDVTHATDYPTMNIILNGDVKLGKGCVLSKGPNIYPQLYNNLEETAKRCGIMYQVEASPYPTGTDANVIQLSGEGVKTAVVSIPCRYMHTPYEICSKKDIESAIRLIHEFLCNTDVNYGN